MLKEIEISIVDGAQRDALAKPLLEDQDPTLPKEVLLRNAGDQLSEQDPHLFKHLDDDDWWPKQPKFTYQAFVKKWKFSYEKNSIRTFSKMKEEIFNGMKLDRNSFEDAGKFRKKFKILEAGWTVWCNELAGFKKVQNEDKAQSLKEFLVIQGMPLFDEMAIELDDWGKFGTWHCLFGVLQKELITVDKLSCLSPFKFPNRRIRYAKVLKLLAVVSLLLLTLDPYLDLLNIIKLRDKIRAQGLELLTAAYCGYIATLFVCLVVILYETVIKLQR